MRDAERFRPKGAGAVRRFHDLFDRIDVSIELAIFHREWRGNLENHEIIAADLIENAVSVEHTHHDHLPEQRRMNSRASFEGEPQLERAGWLELYPVEEPHAANFAEHLESCQTFAKRLAQIPSGILRARSEVFTLQDVQRG